MNRLSFINAIVVLVAFFGSVSQSGYVSAQQNSESTINKNVSPNIKGGHGDIVRGLAFSPDNKWLGSASLDGTVKIWEVPSGKLVRTLYGAGTGAFMGVAFSPDSTLIAAFNAWDGRGKSRSTIWLWSLPSFRVKQKYVMSGISSGAMSFSPDGTVLALPGDTGTIDLWNLKTGIRRQIETPGLLSTFDIAFSPDGKSIFTGGQLGYQKPGIVQMIDVITGKLKTVMKGHPSLVGEVALSRDGALVAGGGTEGTVKLWNAQSGELHRTITVGDRKWLHSNGPHNVLGLACTDKFIVSGQRDGTVTLWDIATGQSQRTVKTQSELLSLTVSVDNRYIATGGGVDRDEAAFLTQTPFNEMNLWDVQTGENLWRYISLSDSKDMLKALE